LHPGIDDPAEYLDFRQEYLFAIDENSRGKNTIMTMGLNREPLAKMRRDHLVLFNLLVEFRKVVAEEISDQGNPHVELARKLSELDQQIERYIHDSAQYTAACRAALRATSQLHKQLPSHEIASLGRPPSAPLEF
jgi:hypothetical protein